MTGIKFVVADKLSPKAKAKLEKHLALRQKRLEDLKKRVKNGKSSTVVTRSHGVTVA